MMFYLHLFPILLLLQNNRLSNSNIVTKLVMWKIIVLIFTDQDLNGNTTNYRDNDKYKDTIEIILHFINVKYWNMLINKNGNTLARAIVAYVWREMWWLHGSELSYNEARRPIYCWETMENHKHPKPNPRRWSTKLWAPFWVNWYIDFPRF